MADPPCQRLRAVLEDARRTGLDFHDVWPSAVTGTLGTVDEEGERAQWSIALADTRGSWEAAYAGDPAPPVALALTVIGEDPERCEPIEVPVELAGVCAHCSDPIDHGKRSTARYCGGRCRRDASKERLRAAA